MWYSGWNPDTETVSRQEIRTFEKEWTSVNKNINNYNYYTIIEI